MFLAGEIIVAGFVGKLFRGFLHMLMGFGQLVLGVIKKIINIFLREVYRTLKIFGGSRRCREVWNIEGAIVERLA